MRIIKRDWARPSATVSLWLIPTFTYVLEKSLGVILPNKEWIWLVVLPSIFALWLIINFKITKTEK